MNRRPVFFAAAALALGVVLGRFVDFAAGYMIAAVVFAALAVALHKRRAVLLVMCAAAVFFGAFLAANEFRSDRVAQGEDCAISGRIYSQPYETEYDSTAVLLDRAEANGRPCGNIKLYISGTGLGLAPGDVIEAQADLFVPKGPRNPGGFDERTYLLSQNVRLIADADEAQVAGYAGGPVVWAAQSKNTVAETVDDIFDADTAPVAKAMILGDKQGLDEQTYSDFKDTGMAHILAVSGLHAGILIAFVYYLLRLLRAGRKTRLVVTLLFITAYAMITGLPASILRASVMAAALLLGQHFGRRGDALTSLSFAFGISLIANPAALFSAGFALSYGAVFGILSLGWQIRRWLSERLPNSLRPVGAAMGASAGAAAGTAPVLAASFHRVSTFAFLTNVVVIPMASAAILLVFAATLLGMISGVLAVPFSFAASAVIRGITGLVGAVASVPFAAADVAAPPWYAVLGVFAVLLVISKYVIAKRWVKAAAVGLMAAAVAAVMLLSGPGGLYVAFLDVGQGDAAFLHTEQGAEYFIDGGDAAYVDEVVDFAIRSGYTPDAAFVSHPDEDHVSGIIALYEKGLVSRIYCTWQAEQTLRGMMPEAEIIALGAGDRVMLDEHTSVLILYPQSDTPYEQSNEVSLVMRVEYDGYNILFTGDISGAAETALFGDVGHADIYKAAHHGSKFSSFRLPLSRLEPDYSVVSAGENDYGHPSEEALQNLHDYSGRVYVTRDDCAVAFTIDGGVFVRTYGE